MADPEWLKDMEPRAMRMRFSASTVLAASELVEASQVFELQSTATSLSAHVRDEGVVHHVTVTADGSRLESSCPCPAGRRCVHTAATVLAHRRAREVAAPSPWQQQLESLLSTSAQEPPAPSVATTTCAPAPTGTGSSGSALALRVERSRGSWVFLRVLADDEGWTTSRVTWGRLVESGRGLRADHVEALRAILRTRVNAHHQLLSTLALSELSVDVWPALATALEAGVQILDPRGRSVELREFESRLTLRQVADGYELDATVTGVAPEEMGSVTLTGSPVHGALVEGDGQWSIGGFEEGLTTLHKNVLALARPLVVPEADLPAFARYVPTMQNQADLVIEDGIDIPDVPKTSLVVRFTPTQDPRTPVRSEVLVDYGPPLGRVDPATSDAPWRDAVTEAQLLGGVPDDLRLIGDLIPSQYEEAARWAESQREVRVEFTEGVAAPQRAEGTPEVRVGIDEATDWFDLAVSVRVGDVEVPLKQLLPALEAGVDELLLDSGVWFRLDDPALLRMRQLLDEARELGSGEPGVLHIGPEHVSIFDELASLGVIDRQSDRWRRYVIDLLADEAAPAVEPPSSLQATLRSYQVTGHAWLAQRWHTRIGGILADEMGLGKTMQALALLTGLKEDGHVTEPALVVAPASVLGTWAAEAAQFTPSLRVVVLTDTARRRGSSLTDEIQDADVVVTSYTLLRLEAEAYAEHEFSTVLLDEAQFVKNRQSVTYKAVRQLRAHVKFAMTGTPLENSLMDLWSILSITSPGLFPDPRRFDEAYRKPVEAGDSRPLERLLRRVRPLMLRRTKQQVAGDLPPKQEQVVRVDLSPAHRRLYEKHLTSVRREVLGMVDDMPGNRFAILRSLTRLRQLSLAPQLIEPESAVDAAKIDVLVDMVGEIVAEGHRALVFSSFTTFLGMVRERLDAAGLSSVYLDGATRDRAERIERFRSGDDPLFLISLKAGGFGLTLTEADYVFILDPWWNPAAEAQAVDRTHRIGQERHVFVYRLVASDTIEDKVIALQEHKRELFDAVVGDGADRGPALDASDIRGLLDLD